ncbi:MAG TPA: EF-hand domain-containing protein [Candidatus Poseidoniaceae archaeon]|nr:EF-hand domain-containing protein [Candidatus Poseidoniaceae archaeon]
MFSGRISEAVANQIEKKIAEQNDLSTLSDSELAQLAIEFVGDAPPENVPRETVIDILKKQPEIQTWRESLQQKVKEAAVEKVSSAASNVDPRMAEMIKQQFGQWLQNSGLSTVELTSRIDVNKDGLISKEELNSFIENLSGSQPPEWVSETVISILDIDGDGIIQVNELWTYLESIGFVIPTIVEPVGLVEEGISEKEIEDAFEEITMDDENTSTTGLEEETGIISEENDSEIMDLEEEPELLQNDSLEQEIDHVSEEPGLVKEIPKIQTSIERLIENLHSSRLHSEANKIISESDFENCRLSVERIERNLMVRDSYRGGMTIVGLLDGGPYNVSVLFEPEFNEMIESCIGKNVTFKGLLYEWSCGLRQAKLKGKELKIK